MEKEVDIVVKKIQGDTRGGVVELSFVLNAHFNCVHFLLWCQ